MLYVLKNSELAVTLSSLGAEVVSVKRGECEYIWQGNAEFWTGRAPVMFPICGRLYGGRYTCEGKEYEMNIHGFARHSEFCAEQCADSVTFTLTSNDKTRAEYPFDFELCITYTLCGNRLSVAAEIRNTGDRLLPATYGAHPGFNVPLDVGCFEDYYVEFSEPCTPNVLVHSDTCFNTGIKTPMTLENGRIIRLAHSLFAIDSIFMDRVAPEITLRSDASERYVTLRYDDLCYLGLWHKPRSEAPYICIEPWCGLPSFDGRVDDIYKKSDMFHIPVGEARKINHSITFG